MHVFITIDTELSSVSFRSKGTGARAAIHASSIAGTTASGDVGVCYQMDVLDRYGLKGVFFVDPMPALVWGVSAISDIVEPIMKRGHDVQLHLHTEWLEFADFEPIKTKVGQNIRDFSLDDQICLVAYGSSILQQAGVAAPVAFRAGSYGANDDTLRALAANGIAFDSSFCPGIAKSACGIDLPRSVNEPVEYCGVVEVPIGSIAAAKGEQRHAQLTALSASEMINAIVHAAQVGRQNVSLVSHSFELMSRDRTKINSIVLNRFEKLCAAIARMPNVTTGTYRENPPIPSGRLSALLLPHSSLRTLWRKGEQAIGNALFGAK